MAQIDDIKPSPALSGAQVTLNASGHDDDGDTILQYNWTSDIDGQLYVGSNPQLKTSGLSIGTHTISLTVEDEHNVWSLEDTAQLIVQSAPEARIDNIDPLTVTQGESVHFQGHGHDREGDNITAHEWYALCSGIPELINTSADFIYNGLKTGENVILFRVREDGGNFWSPFNQTSVTVNPNASAPSATITKPAGDMVLEFGSDLDLEGEASGGSGTIAEFRWGHANQDNPTDFGLLGTGAAVTYPGLGVGIHTVYFQAMDDEDHWSVPATVIVDVDRAPIITYHRPESPTDMQEGSRKDFNITARDPDYDTLRYSWYVNGNRQPSNSPSFTFDTTGDWESQGNYNIMVMVDDGTGRLSTDFTWSLNVENVNQPPRIDDSNPSSEEVTVKEGNSKDFSVNASDVDVGVVAGEEISYQWYLDGEPVSGETGTEFTFSPGYEDEGRYELRINVSSGPHEIFRAWVVRVLNTNRPPEITSYSPLSTDLTLNQDSVQEFNINVVEEDHADQAKLFYVWYWDDESIDGAGGDTYTLYCNGTLVGSHTLEVLVRDSSDAMDSVEWEITVMSVNHEPTILSKTPSPDDEHEIDEEGSLEFTVAAYDEDDDLNYNGQIDDGWPEGEEDMGERNNLTFIWKVNGDIMEVKMGNEGGFYTFEPSHTGDLSSDNSPFTISVQVSDGENKIGIEWTVVVENVNRAPVIVITAPTEEEREMEAGDILHLDGSDSTDPDNETLSYAWYLDGKKISSGAKYEKSGLGPGDHTVKLEVSDGSLTSEETFTVRVTGTTSAGINVIPISISPPKPKPGEKIKFGVKVENNGDLTVTALKVSLFQDGEEVDRATIPSLGPGAATNVYFNATAKEGSDYSVKVEDSSGSEVDSFSLPPINVASGNGEENGEAMSVNSLILILALAVLGITFAATFGIIKYSEIKMERDEEKRRMQERMRLGSVSEEQAQAVLDAEAAKAAMTAGGGEMSQDQVMEDQYMFSEETYSVDESTGLYDPTGQLQGPQQEELGGGPEEQQESLPPMTEGEGAEYTGEEGEDDIFELDEGPGEEEDKDELDELFK